MQQLTRTWGLPYKIVTKKLKAREVIPQLNNEAWMREIISDFFPRRNLAQRDLQEEEGDPELFNVAELEVEGEKLKMGKAPGPDGVPNEVAKVLVEVFPDFWLRIFNKCLVEGVFPKIWKIQKLVLLKKGTNSPDLTSS